MTLSTEAVAVASKDEFIAFVDNLRQAVGENDSPDSVNVDLPSFLEALQAWVVDSSVAEREIPDGFSWNYAALMLLAGWSYE